MIRINIRTAATAALAVAVCLSAAGCGKGTAKEDERPLNLEYAVAETEAETRDAGEMPEWGETVAEDGTVQINLIPAGYPERKGGEYDDSYDPKCFGYNPADYVEKVDVSGITLRDPGTDEPSKAAVSARVNELFEDYGTGTYENPMALAQTGKVADVDVSFTADDGTKLRALMRTRLGDGEILEVAEKAFDGLKAGEKIEPFTVSYPNDGEITRLRGKKVEVNGTLIGVREFYPKTDASVAKITHQKYQSLSSYAKAVEERMRLEAKNDRDVNLMRRAMNELVSKAKVNDLPEDVLAETLAAYKAEYAEDIAGGTVSEDMVTALAMENVLTEAVLLRVAHDEGIELTEQDCVEAAEYVSKESGIESPEAWDAYLEKFGKRSIVQYALYRKVSGAVLAKSIVLPPFIRLG